MPVTNSDDKEKKVSIIILKPFKFLIALIFIVIIIGGLLTGFIFHIFKDDTADGHEDYKKKIEEIDNKKELEKMTEDF